MRIPRTRGDGPSSIRLRELSRPDSPHPRGWTRRRAGPPAPTRGFPAPAGMDPPTCRAADADVRIPRTRGDGPQPIRRGGGIARDSPHPRGWTRDRRIPVVGVVGFPAPAGMDPAMSRCTSASCRIPRTRGDGPSAVSAARRRKSDSPHPRGWTRAWTRMDALNAGFPAPAGMDRGRRRPARGSPRIPRTRGDGPRSDSARARFLSDSPHPRGWTFCRHVPPEPAWAGDGFPAPAGMDPRSMRAPARCSRIPRTRGDGPSSIRLCKLSRPDSPHPRGWTLPAIRFGAAS